MSDEPIVTETTEQTSEVEGDAPNGDQSGWEEKYNALVKNHNAANKRARQFESRVRELETKLSETQKEKPENDPVKLRDNFAKREKELEDEKAGLVAEIEDGLKYAAFMRNSGLFVDKSVEQVWKLVKGDLKCEIQDGKRVVVVEDSHLSVAEYLKKFADENDYFAKNPGKSGTGANGAGSSKGSQGMTREAFNRMSKQEQQAWALKNPQGIKELLRS